MKVDEKFQDQNTGEMVSRVKIPEGMGKKLEEHINANGASANNFLQIGRQIMALQIKQREEYDVATKEEAEVGKEVIRLREKMGLDSGWIYNIPLKSMEKREPPPDSAMIPEEEKK